MKHKMEVTKSQNKHVLLPAHVEDIKAKTKIVANRNFIVFEFYNLSKRFKCLYWLTINLTTALVAFLPPVFLVFFFLFFLMKIYFHTNKIKISLI